MTKHIYLVKANDALVSHCKCREAMITYPPQGGCPWCGCGWLFTCIACRKAFTFARGILVDETWEATARRDLINQSGQEPLQEDIDDWVASMKALLEEVEVDQEYVCLDGLIIPTNATSVRFEGWHSRHDFDFVPQVAALKNENVGREFLNNPAYWQANAVNRE